MSLKLTVLSVACTLLAVTSQTTAQMHYRESLNRQIRGLWLNSPSGGTELYNEQDSLDVDFDGRDDIRFEHRYDFSVRPAPPTAFPYVSAAITGLEETQDRLARLYESLDSLSYPSRGGILFSIHSIFREMLLLPIHQIDEFANLFQFSGHRLLNGSAGIRATSTNPIVSIPRVSLHTQPGVYPITSLVEAGTEHPVSLSIATEWVVSDVAVSINDVDITLSAGMSKGDVVNRINEFSENTHVFATSWDITKPIQLYATSKDTAGTITVGIDPTVAGNTIGWIERLSFNPNAIVEIGGLTVEGTSGIFIPPDGPIAGTIVRVSSDTVGPTVIHDRPKYLGDIIVEDHSLEFADPSGETTRINFPNIRTSALGYNEGAEFLGSLAEISLNTESDIRNALTTVRAAQEQVAAELDRMRTLKYGIVDSRNAIFALPNVQFMVDETGFALLDRGHTIGPEGNFSDADVSIPPDTQAFLGFRINGDRYGWLRVGSDSDRGLVVYDAAWEQTANLAIIAGSVPEPVSNVPFVILATVVIAWRRRVP